MKPARAGAVALALLAAAAPAGAQSLRWSDFRDPRPGVASSTPAGTGPRTGGFTTSGGARLRLVQRDDGVEAWVDNPLAGPVEAMLHADEAVPGSDPPLPARGTVPAQSGALLARLPHARPRLRLEAVPGSPNARPRDVEYGWPLRTGSLRIQQAWGGRYSHADDANRYAVDLAAPAGTPVLAAREGVVMQAEGGFPDVAAGGDEAPGDRANFVRVLHDDGTMALYAHLQRGGVLVEPGRRVRRGDAIGLSGNSGRSTAPHLHFVVQANRGMRLHSLPFRMFGPQGILRFRETPPDDAPPSP
jgi:hypothetical protein